MTRVLLRCRGTSSAGCSVTVRVVVVAYGEAGREFVGQVGSDAKAGRLMARVLALVHVEHLEDGDGPAPVEACWIRVVLLEVPGVNEDGPRAVAFSGPRGVGAGLVVVPVRSIGGGSTWVVVLLPSSRR